MQEKNFNRKSAFIYGYGNKLLTATVSNANATDIAYTSFEDGYNGSIHFTPAGVIDDGSAPTGKKVYDLSVTPINFTAQPSPRAEHFYCSFWAKGAVPIASGTLVKQSAANANGWTCYQYARSRNYKGILEIFIGGNAIIDELRIYPQEAQMTTYTYEPLGR